MEALPEELTILWGGAVAACLGLLVSVRYSGLLALRPADRGSAVAGEDLGRRRWLATWRRKGLSIRVPDAKWVVLTVRGFLGCERRKRSSLLARAADELGLPGVRDDPLEDLVEAQRGPVTDARVNLRQVGHAPRHVLEAGFVRFVVRHEGDG